MYVLRRETQNVYLEGENLRVDKVLTTYKVVDQRKMLDKEQVETQRFHLEETSKEAIASLRRRKSTFVVLKKGGELFTSLIPKELGLLGSDLSCLHKCANMKDGCRKLYPSMCPKVRGLSTGIEKYQWINHGLETVGTKADCFFVFKCSNFESYK